MKYIVFAILFAAVYIPIRMALRALVKLFKEKIR